MAVFSRKFILFTVCLALVANFVIAVDEEPFDESFLEAEFVDEVPASTDAEVWADDRLNEGRCGERLPKPTTHDQAITPLGAMIAEGLFSFSRFSDDDEPSEPSEPVEPAEDHEGTGTGGSAGDDIVEGSFLPDQQGKKHNNTRIVGGEKTTAEMYPWQVSLRFRGIHFCGGSLIDTKHVISAAHCFPTKQLRAGNFEIYLGKTSKDLGEKDEVKRKPVRLFLHAHYNQIPNNNDIAIIRLDKPVKLTAKINTVCLPARNAELTPNTPCYVSGFGATQGTGGEDQLKAAEITYYPPEECRALGPHVAEALTENMICAGVLAGGTDSCQGDSGGPLVFARKDAGKKKFDLFGIVSFGWDCGQANAPGIYTKVINYLDWIKAAVKRK